MSTAPSSYARRGFTLIELLVVTAIISILAAVLFPVFSRVKENARRVTCQSNLKQLGLGIQQYIADYDGRIPPQQLGIDPKLYAWPTMILPYIKNAQVFACPSYEEQFLPDAKFIGTQAGSNGKTANSYCGYGTNDGSSAGITGRFTGTLTYSRNIIVSSGWRMAGFASATHPKSGFVRIGATTSNTSLNEAAVEDMVGTIHIVDGITGGAYAKPATATCGSGSDTLLAIRDEWGTDHFPNAESSKVAYRHFDGFNAMYGDGHVKWRKYGTTTAGEWSIQAGD